MPHLMDKKKIANCASIQNTLAKLLGYFTGIISGLSTTLSSACAQKLDGVIPPFQLNAGRYSVQFVMSACLVVITRTDVRISYVKVPWVLLLSVITVLFNTAFYTAATYLPLGTLMLINLSVTYIGTLIFSKRFLFKQTVFFQYVAFMVILLGQCLLLQPCFLFQSARCHKDFSSLDNITNKSITPEIVHITSTSLSSSSIGYILVVGASLVSSLRTFVYRCQVPDISTPVVCFWTGILGFLLSLIIMVYSESPNIFLANFDIWLLLGHASFASCTSILVAHSQQNLHPMIFSILLNSKVVFSFILQLVFPHIFIQGVHNIWEFVGVMLCVLGIVSYVVINYRLEQHSSA